MPIKPSKFKKLPRIVQLARSALHNRLRSSALSDEAHQHHREIHASHSSKPKFAGISGVDARHFLLKTNQAEHRRSLSVIKVAQIKARLAPTRSLKAAALQDVRTEKARGRALRKVRGDQLRMKL